MKTFLKNMAAPWQAIPEILKNLKSLNSSSSKYQDILAELQIDNYLIENLHKNPKYDNPKKLNRYEFKVFSQAGEDGIISEIFNRIGTTNKFFVEFGVGNGLENNSAYLLVKGWQSYWIEGSERFCKSIRQSFEDLIADQQLTLKNTFITAANIEDLFREGNVPTELDLLSIDIDGNDYWVWQAITNYRPRVVILEYNAIYPPESSWVMQYNPSHQWKYNSHMGSSLKALEKLGDQKGYKLVACSFSGVNAFFVREDLLADHFCSPFSAENHYEPARYFLCSQKAGHPRAFGKFKTIESGKLTDN
jgi:Leucine-rich repeat (LRR) protein